MTHGQRRIGEISNSFLDVIINAFNECDQFRDFTKGLSRDTRDVFLGHSEIILQTDEGVSSFVGTQIATLPVVNDLVDENILGLPFVE